MKKILLAILTIFTSILYTNAQNCFDAYDSLFTDETAKMNYQEFHKLELNFLNNLNGCKAISFNVTSINGENIIFEALRGKVVVLNFWFTTCIPCLKEIPELNKLVKQNSSDEVIFIGFAREDKQTINNFLKKFGEFKYKIIPESYKIADKYRVIAWPQSMVIDKNGNIYQSWAGVDCSPCVLTKEIQQAINNCLAMPE
jgi:thiol-disulfide isomerase/thioredoxin